MRPLLSYYGGKQRLVSELLRLLPPHKIYVEPFCGGASLLFAKPPLGTPGSSYPEVINDRNNLITTLYRVAQSDPEGLWDKVNQTLYSRESHRQACAICRSPDGYSDLDIAWATYVAVMQSFSNALGGSWGVGRDRSMAETWKNQKARMWEQINRLEKVYVESRDALQVIRQWDSPRTLFYCDPPYPNTDQKHYRGYTQSDFEALLDVLSGIDGGFMLSCYPNPAVPESWEKHEFSASVSTSYDPITKKRIPKTSTEVVWMKYPGVPVSERPSNRTVETQLSLFD